MGQLNPVQMLFHICRIEGERLRPFSVGVQNVDMRASDHEGDECIDHITKRLSVDMPVTKTDFDDRSFSWIRLDINAAVALFGRFRQKRKSQPDTPRRSGCCEGVENPLQDLTVHSPTVVLDSDGQAVLVALFYDLDFDSVSLGPDGVFNNVENME